MKVEKIREVLRLWSLGMNQSEISASSGVSRGSVQDYTRRAQAVKLSWEEAQQLSDAELLKRLGKIGGHRRRILLEIDFAWVSNELCKKGVTQELLYRELVSEGRMPVSYATFSRRIQEYEKETGVVLRQAYNPGEYLLVDYAGMTVPIWSSDGLNVLYEAQLFVGVLGASGLIFCEATASQKMEHFIGSHVRSFEFFGGLPLIVIPDNLKSGVKKADRYEPELSRGYKDLAEHYNLVVLPARVRKPRDKGKVERAVLDVERWVLAPLRNQKFYSVGALNQAMIPLRQALNNRQMREYGASRQELFERIEKPALRELPQSRYEVCTSKLARVNIDYHIEFEKHWYSVPYQFVRQEVCIRATEHKISVFLDNQCIATHPRVRTPYRFSTNSSHMPANHRAIRFCRGEGFLLWATGVGESTKALVDRILSDARHEQQAYRTLLGIQRLAKTYSPLALEQAAKEANRIGKLSCKSLRTIIARNYAEKIKCQETSSIIHSNLRDPKIYH